MAAYYNEIEPYAAAWLRNLIKAGLIADGEVDERSIVDVSHDDLKDFNQCHFFAGIGVWSYALRLAGWSDDKPVWTGSCPCQPFSAAGKGNGVSDDRHLWPEFYRLISECRPPVVFGEQVAGKDGLIWLDIVFSDLEGAGYAAGAADLCAAGVGAPHIRQRLYFVGERLGHADLSGLQGHGSTGEIHIRKQNGSSEAGSSFDTGLGLRKSYKPGKTNSLWAEADWVKSGDRWRPIEPGTNPLVDGSSKSLVGSLPVTESKRARMIRGYGNAIVSGVAATFIKSYMDTHD